MYCRNCEGKFSYSEDEIIITQGKIALGLDGTRGDECRFRYAFITKYYIIALISHATL